MSKPFIVAFEGLGSSGKTTVLDYIFNSGLDVGRCKFPLAYNKDNILSAYEYLMEMDRYFKNCKHDIVFVDRYKYSTIAYARAREELLDAGFWKLYNELPSADVIVYLDTTPRSSAKRDYENKGVFPWIRESVYACFSSYFKNSGPYCSIMRFKLNPASRFSTIRYKSIAKKVKKFCMRLYKEKIDAKQ